MNKAMQVKENDVITYKMTTDHLFKFVVQNESISIGLSIKEIENKFHCVVTKVERPQKYKIIYEYKEILDEEEKKYLSEVIIPFKNRIKYICKNNIDGMEYINIVMYGIPNRETDSMPFPLFKKGTMYKGMELDKEYTLKELGLD